MNILDVVDAASLRKDIPQFRAGDELKIHVRVIEGSKSRLQVFQGIVIGRQGDGVRETFTIRKVSTPLAVMVRTLAWPSRPRRGESAGSWMRRS